MSLKFIYVVACVRIAFVFETDLFHGVYRHIFFIHSPVDGCLHCFHLLAVVHKAAVSRDVSVYLLYSASISFE